MIRNLKALGLAFAVAFSLSAVGASAASANPALFTAEVGAAEFAHIDGGQVGAGNVLAIGSTTFTCQTATLTGNAVNANDEPQTGPESTYVTLQPTYETCHMVRFGVTRTTTVTTNGCVYKYNATRETAETEFSADLTIECPEAGPEQIELHIYNTSEHNDAGAEALCTYDVSHQVINNAIQLTNVEGPNGSELIAHINAEIAFTNTNPSFICSTATSAVYQGEDTLQATNEEGNYVNTSIS